MGLFYYIKIWIVVSVKKKYLITTTTLNQLMMVGVAQNAMWKLLYQPG